MSNASENRKDAGGCVDRRGFLSLGASAGLAAVLVERFGPEGSAHAADVPAEKGAPPAGAGVPRTRIVGRVIRGSFVKDDVIAVDMALEDLCAYWEKAFGVGSFLQDDEQPSRKADLVLLIGTPDNAPRIRTLADAGTLGTVAPAEQGFALDIVTVDGQWTAVLRAADRLGLQYAIYGFAEHFLGARFVHPLIDLQPETPPMPKDLRVVETPPRPLRVLHDGSHVRWEGWGTETKKAHFSDLISWRWEDWAGNPERVRRFVAWGVKNRANTVTFDDTALVGAKAEMKSFIVSDAVWAYLDARGLKTIVWCGPGYPRNAPEGAYRKEDFCEDNAGLDAWNRHLCINKPAFWKEADDWMARLAPYSRRLAGLWANWQENGCGDGLGSGGGCKTCGQMKNTDKWIKHLDYLTTKTAAHGLPPAGITRTFWGNTGPDDGRVAERIVPHLPPGSLSNVACLPSCHGPELVEAWPRIMDELNRTDNGNRRIMIYREL